MTDYSGGLYALQDWARVVKRHNPVLADMMEDMYELLHTYDYWLAGDYGESRVEKDWAEFRDKWLTNDTANIKEVLMDNMRGMIESFEKGHTYEGY